MVKTNNVHITTDLKMPSEEGNYHRLLCMTGPKKGTVIFLKGKRIILGRGDHCDIKIEDVKISREHAEFSLVKDKYIITDLNTQNGIIVNDFREKQKILVDGNKIVIGQTVLRYNYISVSHSPVPVDVNDSINVAIDEQGVKKTVVKTQPKKNFATTDYREDEPVARSQSKNGLVLIVVIGAVLFFLMSGEDKTQNKTMTNSGVANEISDETAPMFSTSTKLKAEDIELKIKIESLIHRGRREFREGNYFRAMEDFRLALTLEPGNPVASFYNSKAKQRLDEDIETMFDRAKQDKEARKFSQTLVSYASILRLLKEYPSDERFVKAYCQMIDLLKSENSNEKYLDADVKINELHNELGIGKDEVKCK